MNISIEYCSMWNYEPTASGLKSAIEKNFPESHVKLISSSGGVFEVVKDNQLIFSKKSTGRFPEHEEIFAKLSWGNFCQLVQVSKKISKVYKILTIYFKKLTIYFLKYAIFMLDYIE